MKCTGLFPNQAQGGRQCRFAHEISAQPSALARTFAMQRLQVEELVGYLHRIDAVQVDAVGSGSSMNAARICQFAFRKMPLNVQDPGPFRQASPVVLFISQSGESGDVLAALENAKDRVVTVAVTNTPGSTLARNTDMQVFTHAEPEQCIPASGTMTSAVLTLFHIGAKFTESREGLDSIARLPEDAERFLRSLPQQPLAAMAERMKDVAYAAFLGEGMVKFAAAEIALKVAETADIMATYESVSMFRHGHIAPFLAKTMPLSGLKKAVLAFVSNYEQKALDDYSRLADMHGFSFYGMLDDCRLDGTRYPSLGAESKLQRAIYPILFGQALAHEIAEIKGIAPGINGALTKIVK